MMKHQLLGLEDTQGKFPESERKNCQFRQLVAAALIAFASLLACGSTMASQDTQTVTVVVKPLINADGVDLLRSGLSQEVVVAKINTSACEFNTSPAALKALKTANTPDAVIVTMVRA